MDWCWAETPILWPRDVKNWLIGKDPDAGKDWRQGKGMTVDEMVVWHHWLDGHEFEPAPGVGVGQGSLACCIPWGRKESDMTERPNCTEEGLLWRRAWNPEIHLGCSYSNLAVSPEWVRKLDFPLNLNFWDSLHDFIWLWTLSSRTRHPGMRSQVGFRKHHYEQS